jgi:hypothetical protein
VIEWRHEREMKAAAEVPPERPARTPIRTRWDREKERTT